MGWGMIGGLGQGLVNEAANIDKRETEARELANRKDLEGWLMATREQFNIAAEGRAEQRTIRTEQRTDARTEAQKDRDFTRAQVEAPTRRSIKVEDDKASARGKSEVSAETVDVDAKVKQRLTDAGISDVDRRVKEAHADYYQSGAEYNRGARADGSKLNPRLKAQFDSLEAQAKTIDEEITKAMAQPGGWDPVANPGQKQLQARLAGLRLQQRTLIQEGGSKEPAGADPLGLRGGGKGEGAAPPKPGMIKTGGPADADRAAILTQEYRQAQGRLSAAKTDDERRRAQTDLQALTREMQGVGVPVPAAAAPAPAVARSVPTQAPTPAPARANATPAPAAAAAQPAAAAPAPDPLMAALNPSGNASLDAVVGQRAPAIREAAQQLAAAQQQVKQAALSQDTQAVTRAALSVSAAQARLNTLLKDMEPGMADKVRKAAQQQAGVV